MSKFGLFAFYEKFPDEQSCRDFLELRLWKNKPVCPHCENRQKIYRYKNGRLFKCSSCNKQFQVTTGTIFEQSNMKLQKWFLALYLIGGLKKGISSVQLAEELEITQKSAWTVAHTIRDMLIQYNEDSRCLTGIVEIDETYIGGKRRFSKRGRGAAHKTPVVGLLQRGGRLHITPVENTKRVTLEPIIYRRVRKGVEIMTDEWGAYRHLHTRYKHRIVNHAAKEYVRGKVHVNGIEGVWSLLKRSLRGVYHRPSRQHLARYCAEFQFKYNTRNYTRTERFDKIVGAVRKSR